MFWEFGMAATNAWERACGDVFGLQEPEKGAPTRQCTLRRQLAWAADQLSVRRICGARGTGPISPFPALEAAQGLDNESSK